MQSQRGRVSPFCRLLVFLPWQGRRRCVSWVVDAVGLLFGGLLFRLPGLCVGASVALQQHRWVAFLPGLFFLLLFGCRLSMHVVVCVEDVPVVASMLLVSGSLLMAEVGVVLLSGSLCFLQGLCCF